MTNPVIDSCGNQRWYNSNKSLHRKDGPAVIFANGTQLWYINGVLHRKDSPAIIYPDGAQDWYLNGKLHRTDGPAYVGASGYKEWYVIGKRKIKNSSYQKAAKLSNEDMLMITLKYGNVK